MIEFIKTLDPDTVVLLVMTILGLSQLILWHRDTTSSFDLREILIDQAGKASLFKLGQLMALLVSSWVLIHETREGRLSEWLFTCYMFAWAGANLANKFIEQAVRKES